MTAIHTTNEEKVDMLVAHVCGESLTLIAEDYNISRKTVRRRINEVEAFLKGLKVGDNIDYIQDGNIIEVTVSSIDDPVEDHMPVAVKFHDGVVDYVMLYDLMEAADREAIDPTPYEEAEVDGVPALLPVGTKVKIKSGSPYDLLDSPVGTTYGNPSDTVGFVKSNNEQSSHNYLVVFENGQQNLYTHTDLDVVLLSPAVPLDLEPELEEGFDEEIEDNAQYFVTAPQDSLTIVRIDQDTGEVSQRQANKHNEHFYDLRSRIKLDQSQETLSEVYKALDTKHMLASYSVGRVQVNPKTETVVFVKPDGSERSVPDDVAADIITTVRRHGKDESEKLVKFLDKLMENVSFKAIEGLYRFMKHNCIEINEDGSIRAWKGVGTDLHSISSGKIKNSPTCVVREDGRIYNGNFNVETRVDRSEVNDDPDHTCSHGLHVGNREYAEGFGQTLLAVNVEPEDVVAVPKDYNGAKMRCCAYTPLYTV